MNAHDAWVGSGFSGEFESEVALPVTVRYAVDAGGRVEITHLCLAEGAASPRPLVWAHLPLRERRELERAAEGVAREAVEAVEA